MSEQQPDPDGQPEEAALPGTRYEIVFTASGVVGKGTAETVPGDDPDNAADDG